MEWQQAEAKAANKKPDLVVTTVANPPSALEIGGSFNGTATAKNKGKKKSKATDLTYFLSTNGTFGASDAELGARNLPALQPQRSNSGQASLVVPAGAPTGAVRLIACADAEGDVRESKESNNCKAASGSATVTDPNPPPDPGPTDAPAPGPTDPAPPDPEDVAPELDQNQATSLGEAAEFLYTGANPIQDNVAANAIEEQQTAVLSGRVTQRNGTPLVGVRVSVLDHDELGRTATRDDGRYDIAVNGGGPLTLVFEREGYVASQRLVEETPWLNYAPVDDLIMVPYDSTSNVVDLSSDAQTQVAQSTTSSDVEGARRSTLLFENGTDGVMEMPNGSTQPLDEIVVRSTEYTVGNQTGLEAMPGQLPPSTALTYAVELSVDQAVSAGAVDVRFDKPVVNFTDNFLDLPVGTDVPTGYYDREKGEWVGGPDGRVIKVLSEAGGVAVLDVDGDGLADTGAELTALGIDNAELTRISLLYDAGKELWRVQVTHFTPWDYNYPYGPPAGAGGPGNGPPVGGSGGPGGEPPCGAGGSIIQCESQVLGERVDVLGSGMSLNYSSERVPGRKTAYALDIPVSGATIPSDLAAIDVQVDVAGRTITEELPAQANQTYHFTWDGKDAFDRIVQGSVPATVRVGYRYQAVYQEPEEFQASWSRFSGQAISGNQARQEISFTQEFEVTLGTWDARGLGLGGWTLSAQHAYDPEGKILYLGDGTRRSAGSLDIETIETYAGLGFPDFFGDDGPALDAALNEPHGMDVGADGSVYIADTGNDRIRRVDPDGEISTVAGNGTFGFAGDGGQATAAELAAPEDVTVAADGSLYIADTQNNRVRRVAPSGVINTVAGGGNPADSLGDDGPATGARLAEPSGVAVGADGTIYVTDQFHNRLRMISPDGSITTVAGDGSFGSSGDGGPAVDARLALPGDVVVAPDGTVYVADTGNNLVRRISIDGLIDTAAGGGDPGPGLGDGGPAVEAELDRPAAVDMTEDGKLMIADRGNDRVREVATDGVITTAAGGGDEVADDGAAEQAQLAGPSGLAAAPDNDLYVAERDASEVKVVKSLFEGFSQGDLLIPSADGAEVFQFTGDGRHLRTFDALTAAVKYEFTYNPAGLLTAVEDAGGRATTIERAPDGTPTAIVAPGGQRTELDLDANGFLSSVENPDAEALSLESTADGLLTEMTDPEGGTSTYGYDTLGRLISDEDPAGNLRTLEREELAGGDHEVVLSSELGSEWTYRVEQLPGGGMRRTTTDPAGASIVTTAGSDGAVSVEFPDGRESVAAAGPDPRFGLQAPVVSELVETTPDGLTRTTEGTRDVQLADQDNPLSVEQLAEGTVVNGRQFQSTYENATRTITRESPEGRESATILDAQGRVVSVTPAEGQAALETSFDSEGRIAEISQGPQSWTYAYDSKDRVSSRTNAAGETQLYAYDAADRLTELTLPSGEEYEYGYDDNGNQTSLTTPEGPVNGFGYTPVNLLDSYTPPSSGASYSRQYDAEEKLTTSELPSGAELDRDYDAGQRISEMTWQEGSSSFDYVGSTDRASSLGRDQTGFAGTQALDYAYDGALVTGAEFAGPVDAEFGYGYDNDFRLTDWSTSVGLDTIQTPIEYDQDGLITKLGPFDVGRGGPGGAPSSYDDGTLETQLGWDSLGRPASRQQESDAVEVYEATFAYASNGKLSQKIETVAGTPHTYDYTYDDDGQLTEVERDNVVVEQYEYDGNGNRTSKEIGAGPAESATYDAQDRLEALGGTTYDFDADGFLTERGSDEFSYGSRGELLEATIGGTDIAYRYDGLGRRVSRTAGAETTQYLYGNPANPFEVSAMRTDGELSRLFYDESGLLFAIESGGERYNVSTDQVGTPHAVSDDTGAVVKTMTYDSFGDLTADSNPGFELPIGFAGGIRDPDTDLVLFGLRDYDPAAGRFVAKDPALFEGSPRNLYVYVGNDPVGFRDPTGLFSIGGSFFAGIGLEFELTIDWGGISACGSAGVGWGGGVSVDPLAEHQDTGVSAYAEASVSYGPGSLGGSVNSGNLLSECPEPSWGVSAGAGPFSAGYGSGGPSFGAGGGWPGGSSSGGPGGTGGDGSGGSGGGSGGGGYGLGASASAGIQTCVGTDW